MSWLEVKTDCRQWACAARMAGLRDGDACTRATCGGPTRFGRVRMKDDTPAVARRCCWAAWRQRAQSRALVADRRDGAAAIGGSRSVHAWSIAGNRAAADHATSARRICGPGFTDARWRAAWMPACVAHHLRNRRYSRRSMCFGLVLCAAACGSRAARCERAASRACGNWLAVAAVDVQYARYLQPGARAGDPAIGSPLAACVPPRRFGPCALNLASHNGVEVRPAR